MPPSSLSKARYRSVLRALVFLVLLGLITHGTHAGTGDEPHYLAIAHSAAFDFDLAVADNYGPAEPLIAAGELEAGPHVRAGRGGVIRPVHDVGLPLLLAPAVRVLVPLVRFVARTVPANLLRRVRVTPTVMYRHALSLCTIALAIMLAGLLFEAFVGLGAPPRAAFASTLLVSLSPPVSIFSVLVFTELTSALLCLFVFLRVAPVDGDLPPAPLWPQPGRDFCSWGLTGAAIGLLILVHVRNVGLVIALAVVALHTIRRTSRLLKSATCLFPSGCVLQQPASAWRGLAGLLAGLAVPIAVRTVVTWHFWGTLVTTPHGRLGEWPGLEESLREAGTRLAGLFFDQEYGLLIYAPLYALALAGLIAVARPLAGRVLFVSVCYLALVIWPVTNVHGWTGQWSPPARMLMPIVPLLALSLPAGVRALPRPLVLIVVALQITISAYLWQNPKNLWNDGDGVAAACSRSGWAVCEYLPSFVR